MSAMCPSRQFRKPTRELQSAQTGPPLTKNLLPVYTATHSTFRVSVEHISLSPSGCLFSLSKTVFIDD
jgi:hypothetical protein